MIWNGSVGISWNIREFVLWAWTGLDDTFILRLMNVVLQPNSYPPYFIVRNFHVPLTPLLMKSYQEFVAKNCAIKTFIEPLEVIL